MKFYIIKTFEDSRKRSIVNFLGHERIYTCKAFAEMLAKEENERYQAQGWGWIAEVEEVLVDTFHWDRDGKDLNA